MPEQKTDIKSTGKELVISIRDLHKSFGPLTVLDGIDINIYKSENVVVMGRSGSGKSVLIKLIAGLLKPDRGHVYVMGQEIDSLTKKELRKLRLKIGFLFQGSALYDSMTVEENLAFSLVRDFKEMPASNLRNAKEVKVTDLEVL